MSKILYNGKWDGIWDNPKYEEMRRQIKERFDGLTFIEEGHKYFLNGKQLMCVSDVAHLFQEHFDSHQKAIETSQRNFDNENSKYYRMTPEEIERSWKSISKEACETGTERHLWGESALYYMTKQYDKIPEQFKDRLTEDGGFEAIYPKEIAMAKFWEEVPQCYVPIAAENITYHAELNYSGTFDLLFYYEATLDNKTEDKSGFIIFDYKTNKDLYKNFKDKRLLPPFQDVQDSPVHIYELQLSLYDLNLKQLNFKVLKHILIWVRDSGEYEKVKLTDYSKKLFEYLKKNINLLTEAKNHE